MSGPVYRRALLAAAVLATLPLPSATGASSGSASPVIINHAHASKKQDVPAAKSVSVLDLNRFLFEGNVLNGLGGEVKDWMVLFCPHWYGPCKKITPLFGDYSLRWETKHNNNVMKSRARFGKVDCATDKELCNEQHVEDYPTVVHYHGGVPSSSWTAGKESEFDGLGQWLSQALVMASGDSISSSSSQDDGNRIRARKKDVARGPDAQTPPWTAVSPLVLAVLIVFCTFIVWFVASSSSPDCPGQPEPFVERTPQAAPRNTAVPATPATAERRTEKATLCMPADWVQSRGTIDL